MYCYLFKSLNLAINAMSESHQSRTQEVPGLIFSGGNFLFAEIFLLSPM